MRKGRKLVRTEVQPSDHLFLGQTCVLVVDVAGGAVVQGTGKWQDIFHREGDRFGDFWVALG